MSDSYEAKLPVELLTNKCIYHAEVMDHRLAARIQTDKLRARTDAIELFAFATDKDETSQIAAVRLEERRFKRFDFTLLLQPSIFLNRLAEDLVRLSLTARYWSAETNENRSTGSHHDLPQS